MHHLVAHTHPGRTLVDDPALTYALFDRLLALPGLLGAVVMPDHVHVLVRTPVESAFSRALRGHAIAVARATGDAGGLWRRVPPPDAVPKGLKRDRVERYVALNPCRARLVDDPLAWPWSTHLDRLGLTRAPAVPVHPDPHGWHSYVAGDPSVAPGGTAWPTTALGPLAPDDVAAAAARYLRTRRPARPPRALAVRALLLSAVRELAPGPQREQARWLGVSRRTLARARPLDPRDERLLRQLAGDPRLTRQLDLR